jgi:hypothetical protein
MSTQKSAVFEEPRVMTEEEAKAKKAQIECTSITDRNVEYWIEKFHRILISRGLPCEVDHTEPVEGPLDHNAWKRVAALLQKTYDVSSKIVHYPTAHVSYRLIVTRKANAVSSSTSSSSATVSASSSAPASLSFSASASTSSAQGASRM